MDEQNAIVVALLAILKVAALVLLPLVATDMVWRGLRRLAPDDFFAVPIVHSLAKWVGLGLGLVIVYVHQNEPYHDLHVIFLPESPWNISFWEFLGERVNPINNGPVAVIARMAEDGNGLLRWIVGLLGLLFLVAIGYSWKTWRGGLAGRATACATVIVVWVAYLTLYAVSLLFWLLFVLNSWTFLLLAAVLHYYRRRE